MNYSIIIPTCNRNNLLELCLNKLLEAINVVNNLSFEIIVTDDSFNNNAKSLIENKYSMVKWVQGPKKGPAANRNNGARISTSEWLIFLDDDCMPTLNLLETYHNAVTNRKRNQYVFEGKIIADRHQERFDEEAPININGGSLWSCNFCIQRDFFNTIGQFDEQYPFPSMEDADLNERILKSYEVVFLENATVIHPWRKIKFFKNFYPKLYSYKFFVNKHHQQSKYKFRLTRIKIFVHGVLNNFILLAKFRFKGIAHYFELNLFNFISIFL
ncbi:MAG: glycosyltransferase [Sphingobacteriia bacterium]